MSSAEDSLKNILPNIYSDVLADESFKPQKLVLKPCCICRRSFNIQSLERHEKICEKSKKCIRRNVFNSFSQRARDLGGIPVYNNLKEEDKKKCKKGDKEQDNSLHVKCKRKSDSNLLNNGLALLNKVSSDYQQCPSCSRYFSQKAADRHIAWCTEQRSRLPKASPNTEALERLKARVKYQAPLPKKKTPKDSHVRLIKSADPIREQQPMQRTYSSPSIPIKALRSARDGKAERSSFSNSFYEPKKSEQSFPSCNSVSSQDLSQSESHARKAVKFKEIFPIHKEHRNKSLDMLAALKLKLSELELSDDLNDYFMKSNENEFQRSFPKHGFSGSKDFWSGEGEALGSQNSSSDRSFPTSKESGSPEKRMPRFCYNCGTKYPIVSAKFCCECGARRFIFGENNNLIYA